MISGSTPKTPKNASAAEQPVVSERLPISQKAGWGMGSVAGNFTVNSANQLALPVYNVLLGVDVVLLGIALAIPRFIDALTDPLMGIISDNTRTRWGRRRPYIFVGAILTALMAFLLWMPPVGASTTVLFVYFMVISVVYYIGFTIMGIPHAALGLEMTMDYDERTRVQAWGMILGLLCGLSIPWLYKLTLLDWFKGDELLGIKTVGASVALIILITGIIPALICRERVEVADTPKCKILKALGDAFKIKPFVEVLSTQLIAITATFMVAPCLLYLNIFYLFDGDKSSAATYLGFAGMTQMIFAFIGIPINTWLSSRYGKKIAVYICIAIAAIGFASYFVTLVPGKPWIQLFSNAIVGFGVQGIWLMSASMLADVCDLDELKNEYRREGLFGSVSGFSQKAALAIAGLFSGFVVSLAGYETDVIPSAKVLDSILLYFVVVQLAGLAAAFYIIRNYPLTRLKMEEIRFELNARLSGASSIRYDES